MKGARARANEVHMLGIILIFVWLFLIGRGIGEYISVDSVNKEIEAKNLKNGEIYYFNSRGRLIYAPTGEECWFKTDDNNHETLVSLKSRKFLYDITQEKINKSIAKDKKKEKR